MNILVFFIGYIIGSCIIAFVFLSRMVGVLRVDHSDPLNGLYMFLEISKNIEYITKKKYILLKVRAEDFIPRK